MAEMKKVEQVIFYFTHDEVEAALMKAVENRISAGDRIGPLKYKPRISAGLGFGSGLTLCLQRTTGEVYSD